MKTKNYTDLSEQNLVDCVRERGCSGGLMHESFEYMLKNGVDFESVYPYQAVAGVCEYKNTTNSTENGISKKSARQWFSIPANEKLMAYIISKHGWVLAGINADSLQSHESGILEASTCSRGPNHAVVLVGYGTDPTTKMDYWIAKNSWGIDWGKEDGYFKLQRGKNACDINYNYINNRLYLV
jgi:C1A family cysteine protease